MDELEQSANPNALPLKTMLLEYRLEAVLGTGGFGITYLGWDTHLEKHVAIKEYLPAQLAIRALDGSVLPLNTESEYNYKWGLDRFIREARTLAKFSHPNIVRVNRYFEANGTSYMVMDYEDGESLYQYLKRAPMPDEATLKSILMPILDGLQAVHQARFLHRDIKPSNVFMRANGAPVLLDFGSARLASGDISKSMTAIVSPGYAPLEQYSNDGHQGPWSDIYALSAVIYRAVTSENPPDAVKRMKSDTVPHALTAAGNRYSERFLKAIEWGMNVDERMRPQNIAEWRDLFTGRAPMTSVSHRVAAAPPHAIRTDTVVAGAARAGNAARTVRVATRRQTETKAEHRSRGKWIVLIAICLLALAVAAMMSRQQKYVEPPPVPRVQQMQPPESAPPASTEMQTEGSRAVQPPSPATSVPQPTERKPAPSAFMRKDLAGKQPPDGGNAQRPQTPPDTGIPRAIRKEFEVVDRDGNGYLSRDEIRGKFPFIEQNFAHVDTDGDGRISPVELMQLRTKQQGSKFGR